MIKIIGITVWALVVGLLGLYAELTVINIIDEILTNKSKKKRFR